MSENPFSRPIAVKDVPPLGTHVRLTAEPDERQKLAELLAAGRNGDAAALFLMEVGMPAEQIEPMRAEPWWFAFEVVAPTLAYDADVLGEDRAVPTSKAARVSIPALVMDGGASDAFMHETAVALANAMPQGKNRTLPDQIHSVAPEAIAPVLKEFFAG